MTDQSRTILIIEDDTAQREALLVRLQREGFMVETARNGAHALTLLETCMPDLILLDLNMPVLSGKEFLEQLQVRRTHMPPIIVLTNDERLSEVSELLEHAVTDYLVKADTSMERLVALVRERLSVLCRK